MSASRSTMHVQKPWMASLILVTYSSIGASFSTCASGSSWYTRSNSCCIHSTFYVASSCSCFNLMYSFSEPTFSAIIFTISQDVFSACTFNSCVVLICSSCKTSICSCDSSRSMWPISLDCSYISVMGNLTAPISSLIILRSPMTTKDWEISGPTSLVLVMLVVGSSFVCFPCAIFAASNIFHNSSIYAYIRLFISSCCVLKCVISDFFYLVMYLPQILFCQFMNGDFLNDFALGMLFSGSPYHWIFSLSVIAGCW